MSSTLSGSTIHAGHSSHVLNWSIMQRADDPDVKRANRQLKEDIANGATGVAVILEGAHNAFGFGLPAKDDAIAQLFRDVDLDGLHIRLDNHPHGRSLTEKFIEFLQNKSFDPTRTRITFGIDPVATLATTGRLKMSIAALKASLPQSMSAFFSSGLPGIVLEADGRPYHNAGATEAQEIGAMLSVAHGHLKMVEEGRHHIAYALPHIGFATALDQNPVIGMAKLHALRRLWRRLQEGYGIANPFPAVIHVETSMRMMTRQNVTTNIIRTTAAAYAAIAGGAVSLSILPCNAPLGLPDAAARREARNCHLVFAAENGGGQPLHLMQDVAATDMLAETAWEEYRRFEKEGGILQSLIDGNLVRRFNEAQDLRVTACIKGEQSIPGMTGFRTGMQKPAGVYAQKPSRFRAEGIRHCHPLMFRRLDTSFEEAALNAPVDATRINS